MRLKLWTLYIAHRHGGGTTIHATEAQAEQALVDWARMYWDEVAGQAGVPDEAPEDDLAAVQLYFDHQDDEWHEIGFEVVDVTGAEVVPDDA
jgi:hypothetical protein